LTIRKAATPDMTVAIYARKSTDQTGVANEQKSVARQVEHAKAYASRKGWTVAEEHIYIDDGISGAEFANRPGFLRLMNTLKPRPAFQVLVMSEESRLGREQLEVGYALKQIIKAGVRVFLYLEDRERTLDSPTDKIMLSLTAYADELERERARQRTYDAMLRKAKSGHVTGGQCFGYQNVEVRGADGKRSHVERRIREREAAIVRRIFELCASGTGYTRIAKTLNAEGAPSPRPQQERPAGWAPTSTTSYTDRSTGASSSGTVPRKRDRSGERRPTARPDCEWLRQERPELRIVSEALWNAAHARLTGIRARLTQVTTSLHLPSHGPKSRHARDVESRYLLTGFARCAVCGSSFYPMSRSHGKQRAFFYGCSAHCKRGRHICANDFVMRMETIDAAVLQTLGGEVLRPAVAKAVIEGVLKAMDPKVMTTTADKHRAELASLEREIARLTEAIAIGGDMPTLLAAMKARQTRQDGLRRAIAGLDDGQPHRIDRRVLERQMRERLARWTSMLTSHVDDGRTLFREILVGPIRFTPDKESGTYSFEGIAAIDRLFSGIVRSPFVASPTGFEPVFWP
jgi:site-specific DNA recombinase